MFCEKTLFLATAPHVCVGCGDGAIFGAYSDFLQSTDQKQVEVYVVKQPVDGFADEQTFGNHPAVIPPRGPGPVIAADAAKNLPRPTRPKKKKTVANSQKTFAGTAAKVGQGFDSVCCPKGENVCHAFWDAPCGARCS